MVVLEHQVARVVREVLHDGIQFVDLFVGDVVVTGVWLCNAVRRVLKHSISQASG